jgi:hypothetical protein
MVGILPKKTFGVINEQSLRCIGPAELAATARRSVFLFFVVEFKIFAVFKAFLSTNHQIALVEWSASDQKRHVVLSNEQSLLYIGPAELAATENR